MKMKTNTKALFALFTPIIIPFLVFGVLAATGVGKVTHTKADEVEEYVPYEIANKGFETGNLDGWRVYKIWKDEEGMASFQRIKSDKITIASRVTTGTYFSGNNHYNRDGDYNLGVTNNDFPWNQSEERMGHLRSSDFVLGGSGIISFKLGGSKHHEFAYMSIREADTNIEVARFGNPYFDDRVKAGEIYAGYGEVAEAFLFPYYFDLTSVTTLGTKLYIMLSETSSYEWSILSADSFETYYPGDSEDIEDALLDAKMIPAVNILPEVLGIDTADNSIKNGEFDTNYDHWNISTVGKGWGWKDNKSMRSNIDGGNGGIGILRSSAFTITSSHKYLKLDWAGGLKNDKQIFISIKEVGTNIELLRYVRRDNLSGKEADNFDNHICSLSSLDTSKKYYVEFADNITSDWGVSYVDYVRISDNGNPDGDRAKQILEQTSPTYDYTKEHEAEAFAVHFLELSGPVCEAMDGDFGEVWGVLSAHYASLSDDAKNHFVSGSASELALLAARERYVYIISKYTALDRFVTDSEDNAYLGLFNLDATTTKNPSLTVVFVIIALTLVTTGTFLISTKRKSKIN